MTSFSPTISVNRLVILKNKKPVYDQNFHPGVNIIRGDNGTGKSTIMEFIYYALGGDVKEWTKEAKWCEYVFCEVLLNSKMFTFIREVQDADQTKMAIYEGAYEDAAKKVTEWSLYPYKRSEQKKSFSQVIFDVLKLPYHKTEEHANLTLHQLFRLIYLDQITPPTIIFKEEDSRADSESTRIAIGEYLLGLDDLESHQLRQELLLLNKQFDSLSGELRAIYRFLGANNAYMNEQAVVAQVEKIKYQIREKLTEIEKIKVKKEDELKADVSNRVKGIRASIEEINAKIAKHEEEKNGLLLDVMDSNVFVQTLRQKLKYIDEGEETCNSLGLLSFVYCPACLAAITPAEEGCCSLCKTATGKEEIKSAYLSIRQQVDFQIKESSRLLEMKTAKVNELSSAISGYKEDVMKYKSDYVVLTNNISLYDATSAQLLKEVGALENSITNLQEKMKLAKELDQLSEKKEQVNSRISKVKEALSQLKESNSRRREKVIRRLRELALEIIRLDDFEWDFEHAEDFDFDFAKNKTEINGRSRFSASSMVYLKNTFRLSMLLYSLQDGAVRLPRFLLMDNIEDKGMQPQRSQTFQHAILDFTGRYTQPFQIIFTTSMIAPDLNESPLCIGPFYEKGSHTLDFGKQ